MTHWSEIDLSFYKNLLDNLYDGVYFVDRERSILYWNSGAERISGYTKTEVLGKSCFDGILMHVDEQGKLLCQEGCPLAATIEDGQPREAQVYLHHKNGHRIPVAIRAAPMRNNEGDIIGAVETFSDNSVLVRALQKVQELNNEMLTDPLTGVGNRRFVELKIETALTESERSGLPFGLLFVDIDNFKEINDTYGHAVGDQVLAMVAETLRHNVRSSDQIGRWGGDEFVVIVQGVNKEQLYQLADKLRGLVSNSSLTTEQGEAAVTVSIGATTGRRGDLLINLFTRADQLLYQSKSGGRNTITTSD